MSEEIRLLAIQKFVIEDRVLDKVLVNGILNELDGMF